MKKKKSSSQLTGNELLIARLLLLLPLEQVRLCASTVTRLSLQSFNSFDLKIQRKENEGEGNSLESSSGGKIGFEENLLHSSLSYVLARQNVEILGSHSLACCNLPQTYLFPYFISAHSVTVRDFNNL